MLTDPTADVGRPINFCFADGRGGPEPVPMPACVLPAVKAQALADLLPLLACGEESAALVFDGFARGRADATATALARIAAEERGHGALIAGIRDQLPAPRDLASTRAAARRFYLKLQERDPMRHIVRITALDSAACTVLSALTRTGQGISDDPQIRSRLRCIQREEVGHVRLTLALSSAIGRARAPILEETRAALATLLTSSADCFEALAVDPDALLTAIRTVPGALSAQQIARAGESG